MLDEIEGKKKVNVIKEHCLKKVSDGIEPLKESSISRPSFVSTTSSSSNISCYPKSLSTLQDAWESPVESLFSSSSLRIKKVEKISLARGNGIGMHSMNNSGGREHKQFLKTKAMSKKWLQAICEY